MPQYKYGLVLEGGGMRGVFTAGVLDAFLDYGVSFPYVIGTSAGATNGAIYLARQRGRARYIDVDLQTVRPYVGLSHFLRGKGVIDLDFLFDEIPEKYFPFDFETYRASPSRLVMVSTSALTGQAVYTEEKDDFRRFVDASRASCSLPILCPSWHLDGEPQVDGGVADSIPFDRAMADGCERVVVVMTKEASFRRSERKISVPRFLFGKYAGMREALLSRNERYNRQLERLEKLEAEGRAIVIRPLDCHGVGRTTSDRAQLDAIYEEGLRRAKDFIAAHPGVGH